jgi:hypothetical protein
VWFLSLEPPTPWPRFQDSISAKASLHLPLRL